MMSNFWASDFWGFGGYRRAAEGYMSWQHLTFVTTLMAIMFTLAIVLGKKNRNQPMAKKNIALIVAALIMDGTEFTKVLLKCTIGNDPQCWKYALPLFMCSIQLITLPLAAFAKGRIRDASLDCVCIFGLIGAVLGTYFAGQNYGCYPVLSLDNVASGLTHSSMGFAALYIMISGMTSMKKQNIWVTFCIMFAFCVAAYIANLFVGCNYMFLMQGDGTPYDIVYNWVGGHEVLYPLMVVLLFIVYISAVYGAYFLHKKLKNAKNDQALGA